MLKKLFLCALVFASTLNIAAQALSFAAINPENVKRYNHEIAFIFKRSSLIKKAALGTVVVGVGYLAYQWSQVNPEIKSSDPEPAMSEDKQKELLKHVSSEFEKLKVKLTQFGSLMQDNGYYVDAPTWGQWTKGWANWFGRMFTLSFVGSVASLSLSPIMKYFKALDAAVDKSINQLFPSYSISWYLTTHANLPLAFNDLNRLALAMDAAPAHDDNKEFAASWHILVDQTEHILGYIAFRTRSLGPLLQIRSKHVTENILRIIDQTMSELSGNCPTYAESILKLRTKLDEELHSFLEIEQIERS